MGNAPSTIRRMTPQGQDSKGKGRATPKRKESESKRKKSSLSPIVGKEQKKAAKALAKQNRMIQRAAYLRGEDSALPVRDRGPVRRFVRNYVDSRRSTGEFFLPIIFLVLILTLIPVAAVQIAAIALMYGVLLFAVIDGFFLARRIRRIVSEKFPDAPTKGLGMYAWLRSTQMRRLRAPHPSVKVGESFK
ncbi:unannotated protein [freshwater metagenome]|uniref:Unannotated protein n=1 Tax=freshwater metagenome TaxID=449393 RepID=A0A6J6K797_9ZZZZ